MQPVRRTCAKVLLVDPQGRVLLFSGIDRQMPEAPPVWFRRGGANDGESLETTAIRETLEETGFEISNPGAPVFTRRFEWVFEGVPYDQDEMYFLVRVPERTPTKNLWTEVETATILGHRWWTVEELRRTSETVFPDGLADLLDRLL